MSFSNNLNELPQSTKKLLSFGLVIGLFVALPLFVWSLVNLNFNQNKKASNGQCLPYAYFDTVLTDANGDNAGICKLTSKLFDANQTSCNETPAQSCTEFLIKLGEITGVAKVYNGCFSTIPNCQRPNGRDVSFRYYYDTSTKKCMSTSHRYDNAYNTDADDPNHRTCVDSLNLFVPNSKKVCYESKTSCATANMVAVTPTPNGTTDVNQPNSCGGTCGSNYNCQANLACFNGYCRNPFCNDRTDCNCLTPSPKPTVKATATNKPTVKSTAKATVKPTIKPTATATAKASGYPSLSFPVTKSSAQSTSKPTLAPTVTPIVTKDAQEVSFFSKYAIYIFGLFLTFVIVSIAYAYKRNKRIQNISNTILPPTNI